MARIGILSRGCGRTSAWLWRSSSRQELRRLCALQTFNRVRPCIGKVGMQRLRLPGTLAQRRTSIDCLLYINLFYSYILESCSVHSFVFCSASHILLRFCSVSFQLHVSLRFFCIALLCLTYCRQFVRGPLRVFIQKKIQDAQRRFS